MTFEQTLSTILSINPLLIVKMFTLIGFVLYTAFAIVMVRQTDLMSQVIKEEADIEVRVLTITHLLASLLIFLLALIIL